MTYNILLKTGEVTAINGHKCILSELPQFNFFHYRANGGYFVCETITGAFVSWGSKLKKAKKIAVSRILNSGEVEFKKQLAEVITKHGSIN